MPSSRDLVPAPDDTAETFAMRQDACRRFGEVFPQDLEGFPTEVQELFDSEELSGSLDRIEEYFGVRPSWVPVFKGKRLPFWQGALTWVLDLEDPPTRVAAVQLGAQRFWSYDLEETLSHELVHVARLSLDSDVFEEFFAYRLSERWWRRVFGPLFTRTYEVVLFMFLAFTTYWSTLPFALFLMAAIVRLIWRHRMLSRAESRLFSVLQDEAQARQLLFRLNDAEIRSVAGQEVAAVRKWIATQPSWRW